MTGWEISGKHVLVTGATNGIGRVTALELAGKGAIVSIAARSEQRCRDTQKMILDKTGSEIKYYVADLSSQAQIREFAKSFLSQNSRLDVLVNNAGAIFAEREETVDGIEMTFGLNHLGPFLLTSLLLDLIRASAPARIINLSSAAHIFGKIDFDDLQGRRKYSSMKAYSQSKLANILFTRELVRRLGDGDVTVNALHPGIVKSGFGLQKDKSRSGFSLFNAIGISPEKGAETSVFLASSAEASGITGKYWAKTKQKRTAKRALDEDVQKRLWEISEEMTGLKKS